MQIVVYSPSNKKIIHCDFFIRRGTNPIQTIKEKNMEERETEFLSILESNISILIKIARVYAYTTQDRKDQIGRAHV